MVAPFPNRKRPRVAEDNFCEIKFKDKFEMAPNLESYSCRRILLHRVTWNTSKLVVVSGDFKGMIIYVIFV